MGWECYYSGILPDIILQEKVICFVRTFFEFPPDLLVTPCPHIKYKTKMVYWQGYNRYEHDLPDHPCDYYGIVQSCDRKDGIIFGGEFIFDRTEGGRLISFEKIPAAYLDAPSGQDGKNKIQVPELPVILTHGSSVRGNLGFPLLLNIIRLRWWPGLECHDDDDFCLETSKNIWKYGLTNRLMDEDLDYRSCAKMMKKEHEKYFPPPPREETLPRKAKPVLFHF
jgi:hypothetical protein